MLSFINCDFACENVTKNALNIFKMRSNQFGVKHFLAVSEKQDRSAATKREKETNK